MRRMTKERLSELRRYFAQSGGMKLKTSRAGLELVAEVERMWNEHDGSINAWNTAIRRSVYLARNAQTPKVLP